MTCQGASLRLMLMLICQFEKDLKSRLNDKLHVQRFPNAVHGFAVRGDDMVATEKKQKEDS
jgi:hypothetical protein